MIEILFEFLFEIYAEFVQSVVPERKLKKWQEILLKLLSVLAVILMFALVIAGVIICKNGNKKVLGIILLVLGISVFVVQTTLVAVVLIKKHAER